MVCVYVCGFFLVSRLFYVLFFQHGLYFSIFSHFFQTLKSHPGKTNTQTHDMAYRALLSNCAPWHCTDQLFAVLLVWRYRLRDAVLSYTMSEHAIYLRHCVMNIVFLLLLFVIIIIIVKTSYEYGNQYALHVLYFTYIFPRVQILSLIAARTLTKKHRPNITLFIGQCGILRLAHMETKLAPCKAPGSISPGCWICSC